jgi:phosphomannomutase
MIQADKDIKLVAFDLDDTLAPSKSKVDPVMAALLVELTRRLRVCIISGGRFEQFQSQVLTAVVEAEEAKGVVGSLAHLHLMPTCGTQYYEWVEDRWSCVYAENLPQSDRMAVVEVVTSGARELGMWEPITWGPRIEDRGSQITFSALGQEAPVAAKRAWDPDGSKKERLRAYTSARLPDLEVRSGGSTSVDVTRRGVDKAYGMQKLMNRLQLRPDEVLFVGDRLDAGGNDYPVKAMGVPSVAVQNWHDTAALIRTLITDRRPLGSGMPAQRRASELS